MTDLQSSLTVFRVPRSHWHCTLENFVWDAVHPPSLRKHLLQFLHTVATGGNAHLILTGPPGLGKTHLSIAAYRRMVTQVGTILTTWINIPSFCDRVKNTYTTMGGPVGDPVGDYSEALTLVVLDDLFGRDLTQHEASQIVNRLLDVAYQNDAAVLVTMNQDIGELSARLPQHEISRLLAHSTVIPISGERDWRLRK